jgi:hypothetical protein
VSEEPAVVDHYSAEYGQFAAGVHEQVRRAMFGEDVGQNSWLTVDELERFAGWLGLGPSSVLLDVWVWFGWTSPLSGSANWL